MKKPALALIALVVNLSLSGIAYSANWEAESCQFVSLTIDSDGNTSPPGLDEPLNCDHKCFYDELGINMIGEARPNLHDMYSIGWRLVQIINTTFRENEVWWVYLERETDGIDNSCDEIYAPKNTNSNN